MPSRYDIPESELHELRQKAAIVIGPEKSCHRKKRYGSYESAEIGVEKAKRRCPEKKFVVYGPCPFCCGYHIGGRISPKRLLYLASLESRDHRRKE